MLVEVRVSRLKELERTHGGAETSEVEKRNIKATSNRKPSMPRVRAIRTQTKSKDNDCKFIG